MMIFASEEELIKHLNIHDALVRECACGSLPFWEFAEKYDNFYWRFALDGHESDSEERELLEKYNYRILPHKLIAETILHCVCSDEDAKKENYKNANRFGADVAVSKIKVVSENHIKE
jgi:hypothetical protein